MTDPSVPKEEELSGFDRRKRHVGWEFINAPENSLGTPSVIDGLLREVAQVCVEARKRINAGELDPAAATKIIDDEAGRVQDILFGKSPELFPPLPDWNTPEKLGASLRGALNLIQPNEDAARGALIQFATDVVNVLTVAEGGAPDREWQWMFDGAIETYTNLLLGRPMEE